MTAVDERLSGIIVFVQAVEAEGFTEAAGRLGITRSAVSKSIARLEQRLGVRLFQRTTRSQSLTSDGQIYYERCLRALAELEDAEAALDQGRREPTGRLRVSVPMMFGRHCVAPVLWAMAEKYSQLDIELSFSDRQVDLVNEGFDLAVRVGRLPDSPNLVARPLGVQRMAIWAAPAYLERTGRPLSIHDLSNHAGIVYGRPGFDTPWGLKSNGATTEVTVRSRLKMDDLQAITDAAIAGLGLAWLPCWMVHRHVQAGELERVLTGDFVSGHPIHAVWPKTRHLPSKTRALVDLLVEHMPVLLDTRSPKADYSVAADHSVANLIRTESDLMIAGQ